MEENFDNQQLSELINNWLGELPKEDRVLFIKRYYYGDAVKKLAKEIGCTENQMAQRMLKLRKKLKMFLYRKGVKMCIRDSVKILIKLSQRYKAD